MFRQGDLYITPADGVPRSAKKVNHLEVEEGEATGHVHKLTGGSLFKTRSVDYAVLDKTEELVHEEHAPITLAPGKYKVVRQREYQPKRNRRVLD